MPYGYFDPDEEDVTYRFDGEGDEGAGDAGGDPGEQDDEDDDEEAGGDGEGDGAGDGDGTGKAGKEARSESIPRKRFDSVNAKLKEFRELGMSAAEARSALAEWRQFKKLEADVQKEREDAKKAANRDEKREALKGTVLDLIEEEIPGFKENAKRQARDRELFIERHNADAAEEIKRLATESGIVLNDRQFKRLRGAMRDELNENEELLDAYWKPGSMKAVIKKVFEVVAPDLYEPALQAADAGKLKSLRERKERNVSRATAGGGPAVKTDAFSSKHPVGTPEWQEDWKAWSNRTQDAIFDAHGVS